MRLVLLLLVLVALLGPNAAAQETDPADPRPAVIETTEIEDGSELPEEYEVRFRDFLEEERRMKSSRFRYMLLGYGLIWVSLGFYLFNMNRNISRVGREVVELNGRLEDARRSNSN